MTSADHTVHQDLLRSPPSNTNFNELLSRIKEGEASHHGVVTRTKDALKRRLTKNQWVVRSHQSRKMDSFRKAVETSGLKHDIVHACGHLYSGAPWVADFEHAGALWMYEPNAKRPALLDFVRGVLGNDECVGIRVWSKAAARSFETVFPELAPKIQVVYPAVPHEQIDRLLESKSLDQVPRILFIGRSFLWKGGREVLESLKRMKASGILFQADFIANIPSGYDATKKNLEETVNFYPCNFARKELFQRFLARADIFVLPTLGDTFGYALVEALTFGLPIVAAANGSAAPEIIRHGSTGFLAEPQLLLFDADNQYRVDAVTFQHELEHHRQARFITDLTGYLSRLATEPELRSQMSRAAIDETRRGRFTVERRNSSLAALYGPKPLM